MLELAQSKASRKDFAALVLQHQTLVQMAFRGVHLTTEDTWDDTFGDVAGKMPNLRYAHVGGDFTSVGTVRLVVFRNATYPYKRRRGAALYDEYIRHGGQSPMSKYSAEYLEEYTDELDEDDESQPYDTSSVA